MPRTWVTFSCGGRASVSLVRLPWTTRKEKTVSRFSAPTRATAIVLASQATTSSASSLRTSGFQRTENGCPVARKPETTVALFSFSSLRRSMFRAPGNWTCKSSRSQTMSSLRTVAAGTVKLVSRHSSCRAACAAKVKLTACLPGLVNLAEKVLPSRTISVPGGSCASR